MAVDFQEKTKISMENKYNVPIYEGVQVDVLVECQNANIKNKHISISKIYIQEEVKELAIPQFIYIDEYKSEFPVGYILPKALDGVSLDKLTLPNTLKGFAPQNFKNSSVKSINIPESITSIPPRLFEGSLIEKITFDAPHKIETIEKQAFSKTYNLKQLKWPSGCTVIPEECFVHSHVEEVIGTEKVKTIYAGAFLHTSELKSFTWPSGCLYIPEKCFYESGVMEIKGIEHVNFIGHSAFSKTTRLKEFLWPEICPSIPRDCFLSSSIKSFVGNSNIHHIGDQAFLNAHVSSVTGIDNVRKIGVCAFGMTKFLLKLKWPETCDTIPKSCFSCTKIAEVDGLDKVKRIDCYAFSNSKIGGIIFLKNIEYIDQCAFERCPLDSVTISNPSGETTIHSTAFFCKVYTKGLDSLTVLEPARNKQLELYTEFDTDIKA